MDVNNPWQVESIEAFYVLKCPECAFYTKQDNQFYIHAIENHPMCYELFGKPKVKNENLDLPVKIEPPENSFEVEDTQTLPEESNKQIESERSESYEPFSCKFCVKSCSDLNNMKMHLKVHAEAALGQTATSENSLNLFGTNEKVLQSFQSPIKPNSKQIPNQESNEMKTEVKKETFEGFEAHEQVGIDYVTSRGEPLELFADSRYEMPENSTEIKSEFITTKSQENLYKTEKATSDKIKGIKTIASLESQVDSSYELHKVGDMKKHGWPKGKKRYPKSPGAPKRPLSGYIHFLNDRRASVKKELPNMSFANISDKLNREWHRLGQEEKQNYFERQGNLLKGIDNYLDAAHASFLECVQLFQ